jgi:hypothetical protein
MFTSTSITTKASRNALFSLTLAAGSVLGLGLSPVSAAVAGDMQSTTALRNTHRKTKWKSDVACFAQQCGTNQSPL